LDLLKLPLIGSQEEFNGLVNLSNSGQDTGQDEVLVLLADIWKLVGQVRDQGSAQINLVRVHRKQRVVAGDRAAMT